MDTGKSIQRLIKAVAEVRYPRFEHDSDADSYCIRCWRWMYNDDGEWAGPLVDGADYHGGKGSEESVVDGKTFYVCGECIPKISLAGCCKNPDCYLCDGVRERRPKPKAKAAEPEPESESDDDDKSKESKSSSDRENLRPGDLPAVIGGKPPGAFDYRLHAVPDPSSCMARVLNRGRDTRYKPAVYMEFQCGKKQAAGSDLCKRCLTREEKYAEDQRPKYHWAGRVGEDPLDWLHMLGTAWAEQKKPKWVG
jgi:hypothetical protein